MKSTTHAFTLVEVLVGIAIIAILVIFLIPKNHLISHGDGTVQELNNARQLQLATMTMSLDTFSTGKGASWAFDEKLNLAPSLERFASNLVDGKYVQKIDMLKLLSGRGIQASYPLSQSNIFFKMFPVSESDQAITIFAVSRNWTPFLPLDPKLTPFGDKGFILMRKGGDGAVYQNRQATNTNIGVLTTNAGGVPLK